MKIQHKNEFILNMILGDPTTCVCQLIFDDDSNDTKIIQYFIMHGLVLCIKFDGFMAHIFYVWSFIQNTAVKISIKKNK